MAVSTGTPVLVLPRVESRPLSRAIFGAIPATVVPALDIVALTLPLALLHTRVWGLAYAALALVSIWLNGGYRSRIAPNLGNGLSALLGQLALPLVPVAALAAHSSTLPDLLRAAPLAVGLVIGGRAVSFASIRAARSRGLVLEPTLIIGAGKLGVQMARTLQDHPEYGLLPVGFLDGFDDQDLGLPILGPVGDLDGVLREFAVERVIVAFGSTREADMVRVIRACDRHRVEVHVMPRFFELGVAPESPDTEDIWGIPLLRLRRSALRTAAWRTKRAFDITFALVGIAVTAPVFVAAAVAVRLSSVGPIFFRQRRVGQSGRLVEILKFRTLRVNDDSDTAWSIAGDSRLTPVGRLLRTSSIDELPQLLNVLKGDMSVVGPRPERPFFVEQFNATVPRYGDRHRVPVGITGWAQVHKLRGDTSIEERARFDNYYIEHWSLWRDLLICFRTFTAMWHNPKGEEQPGQETIVEAGLLEDDDLEEAL